MATITLRLVARVAELGLWRDLLLPACFQTTLGFQNEGMNPAQHRLTQVELHLIVPQHQRYRLLRLVVRIRVLTSRLLLYD